MNKLYLKGFYDIYDMTYEKIQLKLRDADKKESESFDIFADNVEENALASTSSKTQNIVEGSLHKIKHDKLNKKKKLIKNFFLSRQHRQMGIQAGEYRGSQTQWAVHFVRNVGKSRKR